jgi:hypothetical protein
MPRPEPPHSSAETRSQHTITTEISMTRPENETASTALPQLRASPPGLVLTLKTTLCPKHLAYLVFLLTYSHELAIGSTTPDEIAQAGLHLQAMTFTVGSNLYEAELDSAALTTLTRVKFDLPTVSNRLLKYVEHDRVTSYCDSKRTESATTETEPECSAFDQASNITLQLIGLTNQQSQVLSTEPVSLPILNIRHSTGTTTFEVHPRITQAQTRAFNL